MGPPWAAGPIPPAARGSDFGCGKYRGNVGKTAGSDLRAHMRAARPPPPAARPPQDPPRTPPGPSLGVLAGPGTPRDPKSHLFVTKWVAIPPYGTPGTAFCTEFRRGSRQIGPTPSNSTFFWTIFDPKNAQNRIFWEGFEKIREIAPAGLKCPPRALGGPGALFSAISPYFWAPWGPPGGPWGGPWGPPICP